MNRNPLACLPSKREIGQRLEALRLERLYLRRLYKLSAEVTTATHSGKLKGNLPESQEDSTDE
ncbi:hypothetical protein [Roseiconus lacunae]|uniref:DUF465 domain-containing protein n=1 Tax=Roseiconus lacunae TaxID=2605694 RepID=A0ABT7PMN3_9BACT|nr:hypothetical protein [Roseiconus lacunae]MDM4017767.1 hypothetical protein [Roseiconus lacunae]